MSAPPPRKRALYVEDDPQCANLVKEALAELCDVDLVRDGFSALDHARQSPPTSRWCCLFYKSPGPRDGTPNSMPFFA